MSKTQELSRLARNEFFPLTLAEEKVLEAAASGEFADCGGLAPADSDLKNSRDWGEERTIRAALLCWLCTDPEAYSCVEPKGVQVRHAKISGRLNLAYLSVPFPLVLRQCALLEGVELTETKTHRIDLSGSHCSSIAGNGLIVDGSLLLSEGFLALEEVSLERAVIRGELNCKGGRFLNSSGNALSADEIRVDWGVSLSDNFQALGAVSLGGAAIGGELNCSTGHFLNPGGYALVADNTEVKGGVVFAKDFRSVGEVRLCRATIRNFFYCDRGIFSNPDGCALNAEGMQVEGNVLLTHDFRSFGLVQLKGARIRGLLECLGRLSNANGEWALVADGIEVRNSVFLRKGFLALGGVRLIGAIIGGDLDCSEGRFLNSNGPALIANNANVVGGVYLEEGFLALGEVRFVAAKIGGRFSCSRGHFFAHDDMALLMDGIQVEGSLRLSQRFLALGKVSLLNATIRNGLECENGMFLNSQGYALDAAGSQIDGSVFLREGFLSVGIVSLLSVNIGGQLDCRGGSFFNRNGGDALIADRITVGHNTFLTAGFYARGAVRLRGSVIRGQLDCNGCFSNHGNIALFADGIEVNRDVFVAAGFQTNGQINLSSSKVHGDLAFSEVQFIGNGPTGLIANNLTVDGRFIWSGVVCTDRTVLSLVTAQIGHLMDDEASWPSQGNLYINGFVYTDLDHKDQNKAVRTHLRWLERQASKPFHFQPYAQLSQVLHLSGDEADAKKIAVAGENARLRYADLDWGAWIMGWILRLSICHGYRPGYALIGIIVLGIIGCGIFSWGNSHSLIVPTKEGVYAPTLASYGEELSRKQLSISPTAYPENPEKIKVSELKWMSYFLPESKDFTLKRRKSSYQAFHPLVYSFDTCLPIINLHQEEYWLPNSGSWIRVYLWFHIIMGWFLSSLLILGISSLARKTR